MRSVLLHSLAVLVMTSAAIATAAGDDARDVGSRSHDAVRDSYADRFVDTEIRQAALAALASDPRTNEVRIDVVDGVATLTGSVADADAAIAAVKAAQAAGARRVDDQIDRRDLDR